MIDEIRSRGPIPFEHFMATALYGPAGFFSQATGLRSTHAGDFLTSPEVSGRFGAALGRWAAGEKTRLGDPADFRVVDAGAGSGSLLRALADEVAADLWAVEVSPPAVAALTAALGEDRVVGDLGDLPSGGSGVIIANELLDNLPVSLAVRVGDGWEERWVDAEEGHLVLAPVEARAEVADWCERYGGRVPEGGMEEVQREACEWLRTALAVVDRGAVVVIDYGDTAEGLEHRRTLGTLRTYRAHHLGPDPLDAPGATDITVDVNFTALMDVATRAGSSPKFLRQDDFLAGLGLRQELSDLRRRELELARSGDAMERLVARSAATEIETVLHPRGLGDFRVLICRRE